MYQLPDNLKEQLETIAAKLRAMPPLAPRQSESKFIMIQFLAKEILSMQHRGYSIKQVSETLHSEGLNISPMTLRNYLSKVQKGKMVKKPSRKQLTKQASNSPDAIQHTQQNAMPDTTGNNTDQQPLSKATFVPRPDSDDI